MWPRYADWITQLYKMESLFYLTMPLDRIDSHIIGYSYHMVKHMVILTHFFTGDLSPHRPLIPISSKGSFICTFPPTGQHIPQPLMDQLWTTSWKKNSPNCKWVQIGGSIWWLKPSPVATLLPKTTPRFQNQLYKTTDCSHALLWHSHFFPHALSYPVINLTFNQ